jgi:hypothetical protein
MFYLIAMNIPRAPLAWTVKRRVGTEKTHCKPFDLVKTEQWVFGYTLCVYPNRLDYTQFTVMPYWSNLRGRISSK